MIRILFNLIGCFVEDIVYKIDDMLALPEVWGRN
jgi:hypothetical protein